MRNRPVVFNSPVVIAMLFFIVFNLAVNHAAAEEKNLIFSTWKGFEVDKCASIWLLNKIFDREVTIRLYPRTVEIGEGILFDTPDAKFRRYFNMSTYESLARHYKVIDPVLLYIGRIVHDIEVNTWEKKKLKETAAVTDAVNKIIWENDDETIIVRDTKKYFDELYNQLNSMPIDD